MSARALLREVPGIYALLADAAIPGGGGGEGPTGAPDPVHRPSPARLDVVDHRHKLLRGLRWWVDAVRDGATPRVGESVPAMCWWLTRHLDVMAPEDQGELAVNLLEWLNRAAGMLGPASTGAPMPPEGWDRLVPVHVAAELLGVSVRTVQRRADRSEGLVRLGDAAVPPVPRCEHSDLPETMCEHCRRVRSSTKLFA